jgi:hypothetical protein
VASARRIFINFAPAVSAYSLQGHFCALKPQKHKWKYLTAKNTKVGNTPQKQTENNTIVGLVHNYRGLFGVKVGRAHLCIFSEKALVLCGFAVFAGSAKRGVYDGSLSSKRPNYRTLFGGGLRKGRRLTALAGYCVQQLQAGEELRDDTGEIVHDYTRKTGVVHSEIILPENAPPEFADREILWNAVEARKRRHDAQLAREIETALQKEFTLQEQIKVLRGYIRENFVDKGMIANYNIHNKMDGTPHAHIMLTTRHVTLDGFGNKNREWNNKKYLEIWREKWADVNNRKFEEKGLEERIDHRSYKDRGIDKEPTIHLGHEASKLEKRGKRSKRGDINREIEKRNEERKKAKHEKESTENAPKNTPNDNELAKNTAEYLNELKENYFALEKRLVQLIEERNE